MTNKFMKKITLFTLEYPPQRGGVGNYYAGIIKSLEKEKDIAVKVLPGDVRWYQAMVQMILNKADMIWVGQILPIGTAAWLCNIIFKKKYFISFHGMDINTAQKNKPKLTKKILDRAEFITVNSEYTKKQIINWQSYAHKIEMVYPCPNINNAKVDPELIERTRKNYNLKNKRVLLTVARLVERKGMQNVIQVMPDLIKQHPDLVYVVIGSGNNLPELQRMVQTKNLEQSIHILTGVGNQELASFYSIADIFIMPTVDDDVDVEGFGIVYLEAGVFGKPVIATAIGGAKEAVLDNETGILTTQADMVNDINKLLDDDDELAQKLGSRAQQIIANKYTYNIQSKKILKHL
jgi:phosphatidyl-myo-inositol dimannoside synthase